MRDLLAASMCLVSAVVWAAQPEVRIVTDPEGAEVWQGTLLLGTTTRGGLRLLDVPPGTVTFSIRKPGFASAERTIRVEGNDEPITLFVRLVPVSAPEAITPAPPSSKGGSHAGLVLGIVGGVAAAGAGVALAVAHKNHSPVAGTINISPGGVGLMAVTSFTYTVVGTNDPDSDPLTYNWTFGDGSSGSGQTTAHTYNQEGQFNIVVTVSDGKLSAMASGTVTVRSLSGAWSGDLGGSVDFANFTLTQSGASLSGAYADRINGFGSLTGRVTPPREVTMIVSIPSFLPTAWTGSADSNLNTITGTAVGFRGGLLGFVLRRR